MHNAPETMPLLGKNPNISSSDVPRGVGGKGGGENGQRRK